LTAALTAIDSTCHIEGNNSLVLARKVYSNPCKAGSALLLEVTLRTHVLAVDTSRAATMTAFTPMDEESMESIQLECFLV
jgi:hypothetical protein